MARMAKSLATLLVEANRVAPGRSKSYDGWIGDAAHAARASRHNPNNAGVVCALDITHDPAHGMDTHALFEYLRTHPHPDLEYVISNRRVASRSSDWTVRPYTGASAHDKHIHVAVGRGPDSEPTPPYDDTDSWGLEAWKGGDDMDQATFDKMADNWASRNLVTTYAPDLKEAVDGCAKLGLLETKHPGSKPISTSLFRVALYRLAKKAGLS